MKLEELNIPIQNPVMQAYLEDDSFIQTYFDYRNERVSFTERAAELDARSFQHDEIADIIELFMKPFGIEEKGEQHIQELREGALTVVGGQQAGILTGPMLSVYKAITVILLAEQQRKDLQKPVVPIFWIAGEDHDLHEINHVYSKIGERVVKESIQDEFALKLMASDAEYNKEDMIRFVEDTFSKFGETVYTKELLMNVLEAVNKAHTFTQFFVSLMSGLFKEQGLLFIDAADTQLRKLESKHFKQLIQQSDAINEVVYEAEQEQEQQGFAKSIYAEEDAANLFLLTMKGRMLLKKRNGFFVNDSAGIRLSEEELLGIAETTPERLSNNVVTRPIMQDLVLPVLAFVGGAGEIAYWALLKKAFHIMNIKMPVIVPRMNFTLLTERSQKLLKEKELSVQEVLAGQAKKEKEKYMSGLKNEEFDKEMQKLRSILTDSYRKFSTLFTEDEQMIQVVIAENMRYHERQLSYLKNKVTDSLLLKNNTELQKYIYLENEIYPNEQLQERMYTPYPYLNEYGPTIIEKLLQLPLTMNTDHKVVLL